MGFRQIRFSNLKYSWPLLWYAQRPEELLIINSVIIFLLILLRTCKQISTQQPNIIYHTCISGTTAAKQRFQEPQVKSRKTQRSLRTTNTTENKPVPRHTVWICYHAREWSIQTCYGNCKNNFTNCL